MRIDETEGLIAGERDALAGRWQRRGSANGRGELEKAGMADDGVEIDVALGGVGETLDQRGKVWMLRSLDEAKMPLGQFKTREKIAWSDGIRVAFGEKKYLGSSRWIVVNDIGVTLYSETNAQTPNAQKPGTGIMLGPADMEELFALVAKDTPVIVK